MDVVYSSDSMPDIIKSLPWPKNGQSQNDLVLLYAPFHEWSMQAGESYSHPIQEQESGQITITMGNLNNV